MTSRVPLAPACQAAWPFAIPGWMPVPAGGLDQGALTPAQRFIGPEGMRWFSACQIRSLQGPGFPGIPANGCFAGGRGTQLFGTRFLFIPPAIRQPPADGDGP